MNIQEISENLQERLSIQYYFNTFPVQHREFFVQAKLVWDPLLQLKDYLLSLPKGEIQVAIPEGAFIKNPETVFIGKGTVIEPGAYIQGPCYIGNDCSIRHGSYIRGNVLIGNNSVVGHASELKNAILLDGAHAAHFAYVGDSILGNRVNLGAGVRLANLRLDRQEIFVYVEDRKIPTHLRKFGAIIGDDSQLGCNVVTNPGTLIGRSVATAPCLNFGGSVPSNTLIKEPKNYSFIAREV